MEINIQNMENYISKLNKTIDNFSNNILNIYNELNWANSNWNDFHARLFFTNVNSEKNKLNNTYDELILLKEVYQTIVNQYREIGNKIKINLENRDIILNKFNSFNEKINELLSLYNNLDLSFCSDIAIMLNKQKNELLKIKEELINIKSKIRDVLMKIEEIEKDINLRLSKIDIEIIKQVDINEYM